MGSPFAARRHRTCWCASSHPSHHRLRGSAAQPPARTQRMQAIKPGGSGVQLMYVHVCAIPWPCTGMQYRRSSIGGALTLAGWAQGTSPGGRAQAAGRHCRRHPPPTGRHSGMCATGQPQSHASGAAHAPKGDGVSASAGLWSRVALPSRATPSTARRHGIGWETVRSLPPNSVSHRRSSVAQQKAPRYLLRQAAPRLRLRSRGRQGPRHTDRQAHMWHAAGGTRHRPTTTPPSCSQVRESTEAAAKGSAVLPDGSTHPKRAANMP